MHSPPIPVAVNIVRAPDGRVLLAERTPRQLSAGFWELPGGKVDPGETPVQAAARELEEEIGIRPKSLRPWGRYEHAFRTRRVQLHFFQVEGWTGTPHGREGQRLAWVDPGEPDVGPLLPSNYRVMQALGLPAVQLLLQSTDWGGPRATLAALPALLAGSIGLVQLREPDMAPDQRITYARRVAALAADLGARVLLVGSVLEARRAGVWGVHSTADELLRLHTRPDVSLWSVSCHDEAGLERAVALGADVAVLSPVLPTDRHPDREPLGWNGVSKIVRRATIPVYAQGGVGPGDLGEALQAGAMGIVTRQPRGQPPHGHRPAIA